MKAEERLAAYEPWDIDRRKMLSDLAREAIALLRELLEAAAWLGEHGHTFPPEFQEMCLKAQRYLEGE